MNFCGRQKTGTEWERMVRLSEQELGLSGEALPVMGKGRPDAVSVRIVAGGFARG